MENYTFTISVKDVYGTENPEIPKGYKVVGFRFPKKGELFILKYGGMLSNPCSAEDERYHEDELEPRLILEKLPEKRHLAVDIIDCKECTYYSPIFNECTNGCLRIVPSNIRIPDWCPLPIAK